jgi:hypothetical protein
MKRTHARATTNLMKHGAVQGDAAANAGVLAAGGGDVTASAFGKRAQRCIAPATPASWSRYIDSRLRQFCTR